jgi:transposase
LRGKSLRRAPIAPPTKRAVLRAFRRFAPWQATDERARPVAASNPTDGGRRRARDPAACGRIDAAALASMIVVNTITASATRPMRKTPSLFVTEEDRALLLSWLASAALTASMALRARIVLGSAGGAGARALARELGASIETVYLWRRRFQERGIEGLRSHALPGRRSQIESDQTRAILRAGRPRVVGRARSVAAVARAAGVSRTTVRRLWERHGVRVGGPRLGAAPPLAATLGPASIAGIFIDLPFRALARVRPGSPAAKAPARADLALRRPPLTRSLRPGRAGQQVATPVLLVTALEAFGGAATEARPPGQRDERGLNALLDHLIGATAPAAFEILAGPQTIGASAARAANPAALARRSRLIRARTQGEWLTRATDWLVGAPREQEAVLAEALGHLMDYFAAWSEDSGPFVWMPRPGS